MRGRGRGTLALLVGVVAGGITSLALDDPLFGGGDSAPPEDTMPVSAAARPLREVEAAMDESRPVPEALLGRLPVGRAALSLPVVGLGAPAREKGVNGHLLERVDVSGLPLEGPLRVEYTLEAELTRHVFKMLERGRVKLGHVLLMDPYSGRVLAYASTDLERFPPTRNYPAASLVKVITAAAALDEAPEAARLPCRFSGSPYRLTRSRIDPPASGREVTLRKALATSNNQCFAQLAVHAVGANRLVEAIERFGWLAEPGPAHAAGSVEPGEDRYDVGRLGCGLAGCRITPLHAAQLAATLARGELVSPRWIERIVDGQGRELPLPTFAAPRQVMSPELAAELRAMLVDTTKKGTARSAFRKRSGRPVLGDIAVAGKTGSLSGKDPKGRYEWFAGVAPADEPRIAVAVLLVQGPLWWRNASQIAADVLRGVFCEGRTCEAERVERWLPSPSAREPEPAPGATSARSRPRETEPFPPS